MTNKFRIPNRDFVIWASDFIAVHGPIIRIKSWVQVANLNPPGSVHALIPCFSMENNKMLRKIEAGQIIGNSLDF